eukprot:TRINITY_DN919_c0_g1_i4.p1 TRINITY_DN919_c0_g1~~TRINITY_DN919_c0_g1_i4.p1  ORF type:complete len:190 (+),score=52.59 TRINITY_DN919_c0_g1_i4:511-1080(+)
MDEDDRNLGFYCPQDYYTIYVIDTNPNSVTKNLEDLSQVEKYMISEEDYDKLPDSFRKWKANFLKNNPELVASKAIKPDAEHMKDLADKIKVGDRCKLKEADVRGEVKFIGKVPEIAEGYFVGVKLDEPMGKNNGSIKGTKYFDCPEKYGLIVRPDKIEVGDFPEIDLLDDEIQGGIFILCFLNHEKCF